MVMGTATAIITIITIIITNIQPKNQIQKPVIRNWGFLNLYSVKIKLYKEYLHLILQSIKH